MNGIKTIRELFEESTKKYSQRIAVEYSDASGSIQKLYSDLKQDVIKMGKILSSFGGSNVRIGLIGENSYDWIVCYYTALYFGWVLVPLDKDLPSDGLERIIKEANVNVLVIGNDYINRIESIKENLVDVKEFILINTSSSPYGVNLKEISFEKAEQKALMKPINEDDTAVIMFTSGTTGVSKGVMLSQKNLLSNCIAVDNVLQFKGENIGLSVLPLHHGFASMCDLLYTTQIGGTLCISKNLRTLAGDIPKYKPTHIFAVPLIASSLIQKVTTEIKKLGLTEENRISAIKAFFGGRLETMLCGGAMLPADIVAVYKEIGVTLIRGYGITECSPVVSVTSPFRDDYDHATIGTPISCNAVKIIDGEICVSGENVMSGYYNNLEATNEAFHDNWFRTGDLGYIDEKGDLYITGRIKNVIILDSGKNVYPEEIEEQVISYGEVEECVVFEHDGKIAAIIRPAEEYRKLLDSKEAKEMFSLLIVELNKRLPVYKRIMEHFLVADEFEKTTTRKVIRSKVIDKIK